MCACIKRQRQTAKKTKKDKKTQQDRAHGFAFFYVLHGKTYMQEPSALIIPVCVCVFFVYMKQKGNNKTIEN